MLGFLIMWLSNATIVALVAGFESGEMTAGQWLLAGAGGIGLSVVEAKLIHYFIGERKAILDPGSGELMGSYREAPGRHTDAKPGRGRD